MAEALSEQAAIDMLEGLDTSAQFDDDSDAPTGGDDVVDAGGADEDGEEGTVAGDDAGDDEEDAGAEESDGETEEDSATEESDAPAGKVAAPEWWDADAKKLFEDVPNTPAAKAYALKMQAAIAEHEAKREVVVQKAKADAKAATDASRAEVKAVRGVITKLDTAIVDHEAEFKAKYDNVEFDRLPEWARTNPVAYNAWNAEYQADRQRIESLRTHRAEAEKVSAASFARETAQRLKEIAPEIATSQERLNALGNYAAQRGRSEDLRYATADDLVILDKARAYDELTAKAAAASKDPKAKTTPAKSVRPVAGHQQGTHKQRQYADAASRVQKTGSDEDAINAILAGGF